MRALLLVLVVASGCRGHKSGPHQPSLGESTAPGPKAPVGAPEPDGPQGVQAPLSGGKPAGGDPGAGPSEPAPPPPESR